MNIYKGDSGSECYGADGIFREKKTKTADIPGLNFPSERTKPCIYVDKWINRDINICEQISIKLHNGNIRMQIYKNMEQCINMHITKTKNRDEYNN